MWDRLIMCHVSLSVVWKMPTHNPVAPGSSIENQKNQYGMTKVTLFVWFLNTENLSSVAS